MQANETAAPSENVDAGEDIVRGLFDDKWDGKEVSPSFLDYKNGNTSVSRLAVIPLDKQFALLQQESPKRVLRKVGEIRVSTLQAIGKDYMESPRNFTVVKRPTETNPSHAEIVETFSRRLATKLIDQFKFYDVPELAAEPEAS